ncbi:hypothetical protein [Streptomyces sp. NBC_01800]|nr:hypothetical protein [Streptomyces sp. NBC_01800]WSA68822.1 hypothetical protein OIE65_18550 [Streptomyces sp. NBC_01800]
MGHAPTSLAHHPPFPHLKPTLETPVTTTDHRAEAVYRNTPEEQM